MSAPIIVTALFGPADFAWLDGLRRRYYPPGRNRVPAHLTLFHQLPPSIEPELRHRLLMETRNVPAPLARVIGLERLDGGVAFRIESAGLAECRVALAEAFHGLLIPQDRHWHAHVTIQNKANRREAVEAYDALASDFSVRPLAIVGLAAWFYRDGAWERLAQFRYS